MLNYASLAFDRRSVAWQPLIYYSTAIIGASLSEPHIVVISITFSCTFCPHAVGTILYTSVASMSYPGPIAYNRISTWKTGILRRAAPPACALDPAGLRANKAAWILLAQSTSAVPQSTLAECTRCCRDKYALKVRSSSDLPPQLHGCV